MKSSRNLRRISISCWAASMAYAPSYPAMSLWVEKNGASEDGHQLMSLGHYGDQKGHLMRDPDLVFLFQDLPDGAAAEPMSYRNDYMGID